MKLACLMQHRRQNSDGGSGSKAEMRKFHDLWKSEFLWLIYDSGNNVMYCDVCRKAGPDITGKTEFVAGKEEYLLNYGISKSPFLNKASSLSFSALIIIPRINTY
jgi:hypothetical protein